MVLREECSCSLRDAILLGAGFLTAMVVLTLHWILTVSLQSLQSYSDQRKQTKHIPAGKRTRVKRFARKGPILRKEKPRSNTPRKLSLSIKANNFLYQCGACNIHEEKGGCKRGQAKSSRADGRAAENVKSDTCDLSRIVYTENSTASTTDRTPYSSANAATSTSAAKSTSHPN